jgi:hypothetical protein
MIDYQLPKKVSPPRGRLVRDWKFGEQFDEEFCVKKFKLELLSLSVTVHTLLLEMNVNKQNGLPIGRQ